MKAYWFALISSVVLASGAQARDGNEREHRSDGRQGVYSEQGRGNEARQERSNERAQTRQPQPPQLQRDNGRVGIYSEQGRADGREHTFHRDINTDRNDDRHRPNNLVIHRDRWRDRDDDYRYRYRDYDRYERQPNIVVYPRHYYHPRNVIYIVDDWGYRRPYYLDDDRWDHYYDPMFFYNGRHVHAGCRYDGFLDALALGIVINATIGDW